MDSLRDIKNVESILNTMRTSTYTNQYLDSFIVSIKFCSGTSAITKTCSNWRDWAVSGLWSSMMADVGCTPYPYDDDVEMV